MQKEYDELNQKEKSTIINEVINAEDIAGVVSKWTGIPLEKLSGRENNKLLNIESLLQKRVIGQKDAIEKVSKAIKISKAGLQDPNKPLGSFLFLGPTGVGKTELTKELSLTLFDNQESLVRLDMSEFAEKHNVSRLIGAPPGYVGYEQGGSLTETIRRKPYSVILLDEIEKAHPEVLNILLQLFDDGRLTDGQGRVVDFKNTIIIMTSNIGAEYFIDSESDTKDKIKEVIQKSFRPEFINRIDDIIAFNRLSNEDLKKIATKQLLSLSKRINDDMNIEVIFDQTIINHVSDVGDNNIYGARPIRRKIQTLIENELSRLIISDEIARGFSYILNYKDGNLISTQNQKQIQSNPSS